MQSLEQSRAGVEPQVKRTRQRAGAKTMPLLGSRTDKVAAPSPALLSRLGNAKVRSSAIAHEPAEMRPRVAILGLRGGDRVGKPCDVAGGLLSCRLQRSIERESRAEDRLDPSDWRLKGPGKFGLGSGGNR